MVIVKEVFGIVKRECPERSGGRFGGDLGCRGKGRPGVPLLRPWRGSYLLGLNLLDRTRAGRGLS